MLNAKLESKNKFSIATQFKIATWINISSQTKSIKHKTLNIKYESKKKFSIPTKFKIVAS